MDLRAGVVDHDEILWPCSWLFVVEFSWRSQCLCPSFPTVDHSGREERRLDFFYEFGIAFEVGIIRILVDG